MEKHKQIMNTLDLEKDKKERTKLKSSQTKKGIINNAVKVFLD